jgi:hypothetical protein
MQRYWIASRITSRFPPRSQKRRAERAKPRVNGSIGLTADDDLPMPTSPARYDCSPDRCMTPTIAAPRIGGGSAKPAPPPVPLRPGAPRPADRPAAADAGAAVVCTSRAGAACPPAVRVAPLAQERPPVVSRLPVATCSGPGAATSATTSLKPPRRRLTRPYTAREGALPFPPPLKPPVPPPK